MELTYITIYAHAIQTHARAIIHQAGDMDIVVSYTNALPMDFIFLSIEMSKLCNKAYEGFFFFIFLLQNFFIFFNFTVINY